MKLRVLVVACLFTLSSGAGARAIAQGDATSLTQRANAKAETITDADAFVEEVSQYVDLALEGEYGRLKRNDSRRLETSRDTIAELLNGHASAMELPPDERVALYNAQEFITSVIRNDDKTRVVCRREATTGSRLGKTECMTVAERELRARKMRSAADDTIRTTCRPLPEQPCAR
jgi:hypothetical protein